MNCCNHCFKDSQIVSIIESYNNKGDCDICKRRNVNIVDITELCEIKNYLQDFIETYEYIDNDNKSEVPSKDLLSILIDDWNIFNLTKVELRVLLKEFFPEWETEDIFDKSKRYIIKDLFDISYKEKNEIIKDSKWNNFVREIKYENRYHSKQFNNEAFMNILSSLSTNLSEGMSFYRGRIWETPNPFNKEEMGPPPKKYTRNGRVNSEGVQILYLSDSEQTVKYEIRSHLYDCITIGKFILLQDINIIDLTKIKGISPFFTEEIREFTKYLALNKLNLEDIESHISKPHNRSDSNLDYLPTQYIADLIKSQGDFEGIKYKSTLFENGYNVAIFNSSIFKCVEIKNIEIDFIEYNSKTL